ncbi:MAG: NIPSNAP family protein [Pseudomonadota bacterium]
MIFDHRTYLAIPGKLPAFLKVYSEKGLPLQRKHLGEPFGWFVGEVGNPNEVIHIWKYASSQDRDDRRAALKADPAWSEYLAEALPLLDHMENKIVVPAPFFSAE